VPRASASASRALASLPRLAQALALARGELYQDEDGVVVLRGRLEPEIGAVVMQALTAAREAPETSARIP